MTGQNSLFLEIRDVSILCQQRDNRGAAGFEKGGSKEGGKGQLDGRVVMKM